MYFLCQTMVLKMLTISSPFISLCCAHQKPSFSSPRWPLQAWWEPLKHCLFSMLYVHQHMNINSEIKYSLWKKSSHNFIMETLSNMIEVKRAFFSNSMHIGEIQRFPVGWGFLGQGRELIKKIQVQLLFQCLIHHRFLSKYINKKNSIHHLSPQLWKSS